ncbi:MAG: lactococcin 972 family bacteriocin [Propioniciclava sp.]
MSFKRSVVGGLLGLTLAFGVTGPALASATVKGVGGGIWSYGVANSKVYSSYHHSRVTHRASTINGWGSYNCRTARKGKWANSSQRAYPRRVDRAYWNTKSCGR